MKDQEVNGYEDDDLNAVVTNIEELEAEIKSVMGTAMNDCAQLRKKIKVAKAEARTDLSIPGKPLNAILKLRKKQREMDAIVADVPDEYGDMLADMQKALGEFGDTPLGEAAIGTVKRKQKSAKAAVDEEQEEGERVLDELVH